MQCFLLDEIGVSLQQIIRVSSKTLRIVGFGAYFGKLIQTPWNVNVILEIKKEKNLCKPHYDSLQRFFMLKKQHSK